MVKLPGGGHGSERAAGIVASGVTLAAASGVTATVAVADDPEGAVDAATVGSGTAVLPAATGPGAREAELPGVADA